MINKIRIITTKGCEACNIAIHLYQRAIRKSKVKNIELEIIDCLNEDYRQFINRYFIKDYPTAVFMRDDKVILKIEGTINVPKIIETINTLFS